MNDSTCLHAIQFGGLCAICGKDMTVINKQPFSPTSISTSFPSTNFSNSSSLPSDDNLNAEEQAKHFILHSDINLRVTDKEAARLESITFNRLMQDRKLSLVIDLDQTMLHASINPALHSALSSIPATSPLRTQIKTIMLGKPHYIKLRPFWKQFLDMMMLIYEMHIYTMGSRAYAEQIASIIDPSGEYFADRIVTRDENELLNQKCLKRIFPVNDNLAVIIDDRVDVWGECENLLQVQPYFYFKDVGDINCPFHNVPRQQNSCALELPSENRYEIAATDRDKGTADIENAKVSESTDNENSRKKSTLDNASISSDDSSSNFITEHLHLDSLINVNDNDDQLLVIARILTEVHTRYFDAFPEKSANVPLLLQCIKSEVLKDKFFVFSGIFPSNSDIYRNELWKTACQFGAICSVEMRKDATHLIVAHGCSNTLLTEKMKRAFRLSTIKVVTVDWLYECFNRWESVAEEPYLIEASPEYAASLGEISSAEASVDSDDLYDDSFDGNSISEISIDDNNENDEKDIGDNESELNNDHSMKRFKSEENFDEDSFLEELENELLN